MSEEIARLIATINDHPDAAHGDLTPAVHALVRIGLPALAALLPLLASDDRWTRLRAQRVFEGATRAWVRARVPARPHTPRAEHEWIALWQGNGSYDFDAPACQRADAIDRWRAWLDAQGVPPAQP